MKTHLFRSLSVTLLIAGGGLAWLVSDGEAVEPLFGFGACETCAEENDKEDDEENCSWGPDPCEPRGTLFQWSYGTSFGGGPDLDEPLITDRPDFTESSVTVGRGVAQLEMGYSYTYDSEAGGRTKSHSYPELLLRYGILAEWLELRVGWSYAEETTNTFAQGSEDLYLGFKIALTPQEGILPEMALIPQMTVPSGSAAFTANETLPGVNWVYGWEINDCISTGGSSQLNKAIDGTTSNEYYEFAQSWTIAYSLTDRLGAYTEWFAFIPSGADTERNKHFFNGGFTFLVNNDLQLDAFAGLGLNRNAEDYFVGTGVSKRF
ncbi:MAG: transporter [Planctomycetes bacterium]|nr:transporter [Planctomycetota bacterium]